MVFSVKSHLIESSVVYVTKRGRFERCEVSSDGVLWGRNPRIVTNGISFHHCGSCSNDQASDNVSFGCGANKLSPCAYVYNCNTSEPSCENVNTETWKSNHEAQRGSENDNGSERSTNREFRRRCSYSVGGGLGRWSKSHNDGRRCRRRQYEGYGLREHRLIIQFHNFLI